MKLHRGATLVLIVVLLAAVATSCDGGEPEIVVTLTPTPASTITVTATSTVTSTATTTSTATSTATTPATATGTSTPSAPAGYSTSCAAGYPWGQVVTGPFVCIQSPISGITLGSSVQLSGYAGGSFENNVVVALRDENNATLVNQPLTYTAPGVGMPGSWQVTLSVPSGPPSNSPGRIVVYFTSPRDGQVVALDSIEVRFP
jgi:hypothetical protein